MVLRRISIILHGNCIRIALACGLLIPSDCGGKADIIGSSEVILGVGRLLSLQKERPLSGKVGMGGGITSSWHTKAMFSVCGETFSTGREDSSEFKSSVFPVSLGFSHITLSQFTVSHSFPIITFTLTIDTSWKSRSQAL